MLSRFVAFFLMIGALLSLSACNTVDGVGQDISGAARTVKRAL
jgi:predicted small secreted protein